LVTGSPMSDFDKWFQFGSCFRVSGPIWRSPPAAAARCLRESASVSLLAAGCSQNNLFILTRTPDGCTAASVCAYKCLPAGKYKHPDFTTDAFLKGVFGSSALLFTVGWNLLKIYSSFASETSSDVLTVSSEFTSDYIHYRLIYFIKLEDLYMCPAFGRDVNSFIFGQTDTLQATESSVSVTDWTLNKDSNPTFWTAFIRFWSIRGSSSSSRVDVLYIHEYRSSHFPQLNRTLAFQC